MSHLIDISNLSSKELFPGITAQITHSDDITLSLVTIAEGTDLPEHGHHNEQWIHMLEGSLEMVIDGEPIMLKPGMVAHIPSNALHSGYAHTKCRVMDIFTPVREDLK